MSTKGVPVFTFSLPGGAARPLAPLSVTPLNLLLAESGQRVVY